MKKSTGVIAILLGLGVLLVSVLFSKGSHPSFGFIGSLSRMEIVLNEGEFVEAKMEYEAPVEIVDGEFFYPSPREVHPAYVEGRVSIPLKYPLALSIIIILAGIGIFILGEKSPLRRNKSVGDA